MHKTIISDTSCLILLSKIGELDLLKKVYGKITTTAEVVNEYGQPLPDWIEIKQSNDQHLQQILELQIDKGEASAIALALENENATIIIDDYKARRIAEELGLSITGTIGVIVKAKLNGVIESIKPLIYKIRETNFRLSDEILEFALKEAGE